MNLTKAGKVVLSAFATAIAAVILLGLGGWYWWKRNAGELLESGKESITLGRESGTTLGESSCLQFALDNHKANPDLSILSSVRNGLWLSGCLETSRVEKDFCSAVPAQDDVIARGVWAGLACAKEGLSDPYCPTLLQNVTKYCSSTTRDEKGSARAGTGSRSFRALAG